MTTPSPTLTGSLARFALGSDMAVRDKVRVLLVMMSIPTSLVAIVGLFYVF